MAKSRKTKSRKSESKKPGQVKICQGLSQRRPNLGNPFKKKLSIKIDSYSSQLHFIL